MAGTDHLPFVGDEDALFGAVDQFLQSLQKPGYLEMSLATVLLFALPEPIETIARSSTTGADRGFESAKDLEAGSAIQF